MPRTKTKAAAPKATKTVATKAAPRMPNRQARNTVVEKGVKYNKERKK